MKSTNKHKILVLIPARMGSSRFPGKPMAKILGKPMIGHVYENVIRNKIITDAAVATCDDEIYKYIESINGRVVMTSSSHVRASDRCSEALLTLEKENNCKYDIVVMVQGDEPMLHHEMITDAVYPMLSDEIIQVTNLLGKIESQEEFSDRNCIKVVVKLNGDALYFSREPIPTNPIVGNLASGKQICVIPFRRNFLVEYSRLAPTPLEISESVDMMRVLEHGMNVRMIPTKYKSHAVDTPSDLLHVENMMKNKIHVQ